MSINNDNLEVDFEPEAEAVSPDEIWITLDGRDMRVLLLLDNQGKETSAFFEARTVVCGNRSIGYYELDTHNHYWELHSVQ